jgi:uroporphyrinogen decarboxylase
LAAEITLQPIHRYGMDAAIIFSDILVVLQALGVPVEMHPGRGPVLPNPIRTEAEALAFTAPDLAQSTEQLRYVYDALSLTRSLLPPDKALIGFAGAPWTLFCYWIEGHGSKDFARPKAFAMRHPGAAHQLLQALTDLTITYLNRQIEAGAQVVQVFDSWAAALSPDDYSQFSLPYLRQIVAGVHGAPVILFAKGANHALPALAQSGAAALGLDWSIRPAEARALVPDLPLQGNLDPAVIFTSPDEIRRRTLAVLDAFAPGPHILNLGHGIMPGAPLENVAAFFETALNYRYSHVTA